MMKLLLLAAAAGAGIYALTRPKKGAPPRARRPYIPRPGPKKLGEPPRAPEGWGETLREGLADAVATCAARELPGEYTDAVRVVRTCALDLLFPAYAWPPRAGDRQWKWNAWTDDALAGAIRAALQADVPGP